MSDDSALVEQLSDKVHQAWAAEKQRQGFADHAFRDEDGVYEHVDRATGRGWGGYGCKCGKAIGLHHADMLPYADLAENVKEYDRATVRAVLDAIHQAGYLIVPNMTVPV